MTGTEYRLLHVQEPILYVIRKLHRQSPDKGESERVLIAWIMLYTDYRVHYFFTCTVRAVTPFADYYILGGVVYQCPDLWSIINSRLVGLEP